MTTITFIAHPKQESDNREGFDYMERRVDFITDFCERISAPMCDPDTGWSSLDQWVSWQHIEYLIERGLSRRQIVELMRYVWDATSGVRETVEPDVWEC